MKKKYEKDSFYAKMVYRIRRYRNKYLGSWNYVFQYNGPFDFEERSDCEFKRFDSFDQLPEKIKNDIVHDGSVERLKGDKLELDENASLWIALIDGHVVSSVFTRKGQYFKNWFVKLKDDDVVVFRLGTHPDYRGRGLAPSLINYAMSNTVSPPFSAYIDCRTYNKSSRKCIEKCGFRIIDKKKTIKREWVLYDIN